MLQVAINVNYNDFCFVIPENNIFSSLENTRKQIYLAQRSILVPCLNILIVSGIVLCFSMFPCACILPDNNF